MRLLINKFLLVIFFFVTAMSNAWAGEKDFPALPNPPKMVNDFGGFLKESEEATLEQKLRAYRDSTSTEIAIVTVETIGNYEVADYTVQLFNQWKIGGAKNNNGILILAAKNERKIWITTGHGMEGALPDGILGSIIRQKIQPNFKEGNFYQGFDEGVDAIVLAARGEYKADPEQAHKKGKSVNWGLIIFIIIFVLVGIAGGGRGGGGGGGLLNSAGWIAASMLANGSDRSSGGGWGGGGFGGSSGGGGGFGGFGGGSSGGGGAGGSW